MYAKAFSIGGDGLLLLRARLISLIFLVTMLVAVGALARRLGVGGVVSAAAFVLVGTHHLTLFIAPYARNHLVSTSLLVVATWFALRALEARRPTIWCFSAGLAAGLAVGFKLLAAPPAAALLIGLAYNRRNAMRPAATLVAQVRRRGVRPVDRSRAGSVDCGQQRHRRHCLQQLHVPPRQRCGPGR
ncbi:MAG: glycosyltransferase family 39 protein [Phycisphaerae bacterium]|nr:glycosyltransferase family 39 protein [Phycisphaerae bacterium]